MNQEQLLQQLISAPEEAISYLDLVYITSDKMLIERRRSGEDFQYWYRDKPLQNKEDIERIEGLVIPPAWQNVHITHIPNGHLQVTGRDAKHRKQYRYHPTWVKIRKQTKFYRMYSFGKWLPRIRKKVDADLEKPVWNQTKVLALIVRLMEETHIRIGSEQYARRNQTYGLSTLRKRHVAIEKDRAKFEFVGKKGKRHSVTIRNKKLIHLVSRCEEIPGWELFNYFDENGIKRPVDSSMVNTYIKEICEMDFTAKDFRTWAAGIVFFDTLMDLDAPSNVKETKKNILSAYDEAAKALGNTRNICRKSYVHPLLPLTYENGAMESYFNLAKKPKNLQVNFSPSEAAVLELISDYRPKIQATNII